MQTTLIPIESKSGVTIYGKVGKNGKLGQFEVHSDFLGNNKEEYHLYRDAQTRMNALIGVTNK
jgi:hypothetical protein